MPFGFDDPALTGRRRYDELAKLRPANPPELQSFDQFLGSLSQDTGRLMNRAGEWWDQTDPYAPVGGRRAVAERPPAPWEYGPPVPNIPPPETSGSFSPEPMEQMPGVLSGASSTADPMPGVLSGASSTTGASVGLPPPPQPSGLRVKLAGGDWQEADPEGRLPMPPTERSGTAYDPVDRRVEAVSAPSGGGTFSMMTAPENADVVTRGSQLDDAEFKARIRDLNDPYADERAVGRIRTDEAIRLAEAQDRISMGKQARMAQEAEQIQRESDQDEYALAQKYGVDPRDTEGTTITDEGRRMQYQQEREALKRQIQARMTVLLSRYEMAPRSSAGFEALSGF
jgi:hypothetical protein